MATRGRPKAQPKPEITDEDMKLAEVIATRCGIPGCSAKNHLEEAREFKELVRQSLTKTINKTKEVD